MDTRVSRYPLRPRLESSVGSRGPYPDFRVYTTQARSIRAKAGRPCYRRGSHRADFQRSLRVEVAARLSHLRPPGTRPRPPLVCRPYSRAKRHSGNVPKIRDVETLVELIERWRRAEWTAANTGGFMPEVRLHARPRFRAIARRFSWPAPSSRAGKDALPTGGDVSTGARTHFLALARLAPSTSSREGFPIRASSSLARLVSREPSVTGTENALVAAVAASGTTILRNAARSPVRSRALLVPLGRRSTSRHHQLTVREGVRCMRRTPLGPGHIEVGCSSGPLRHSLGPSHRTPV